MTQRRPMEERAGVAPPAPGSTDSVTVPVLREELRIGTRTVNTGKGVRVRKSVSEQAHVIDETLMHDEIDVKRVPVDRIVSLDEAPVSRYEGDTLIVPVTEEVMVIERRLRISEELHITTTKRQEKHSETVWLKSEKVSVEQFDEAALQERKSD